MKNIRTPFAISGGKIAFSRDVSTIVRQKVLDVLVTSPSERVGQDDYGAGVMSMLFEPIDELTESDFKVDAIDEINRRVSGATIVDLQVRQGDYDVSTADITVYYKLPLSSVEATTFTVSTQSLNEESPI